MGDYVLTTEAARAAGEPLLEELGKTDQDRLAGLYPLARAGKISLADCLGRGEVPVELAAFTSFRFRVNNAAQRMKSDFRLEVDSRKRSEPKDRECWFTGTDPAASNVESYNAAVTSAVTRMAELQPSMGYLQGRGHYAIVFTDVVRSTGMLREKGDYEMVGITRDHFEAGRQLIREYKGTEIKTIGDSFMVVFPSAGAAVDFVRQFQDNTGHPELKIRAAIHVGPMQVEGSDVFGNAVVFAARMVAAIPGGEIWISEAVKEDLDAEGRHPELDWQPLPKQTFKSYGEEEFPLWSLGKSEGALLPVAGVAVEWVPKEEIEKFIETRGLRFSLDEIERMKKASVGEPKNACEELEKWATDPEGSRFFALLGEYGMGKTTTLQHFTNELMRRRREDKSLPLPIYVDLRLYQGPKDQAPTIESLLQSVGERSWRATHKALDADAVLRLVREEGAVILFDGLDEKIVHMTPDVGKAFVRTLWSAVGDSAKGKLLISCRSHYFPDVQSQNATLSGQDREGMSKAGFPAFCLLPFTEDQILQYLRAFLGDDKRAEEAFELLGKIHNLRDLAERPYLLSLIVQRLGELEALQAQGETVNAARLYELFVKSWLNRDDGKHQLDPLHKRWLMEEIAAQMWTESVQQWDAETLERWLERRIFQTVEYAGLYDPKQRVLLKEDLRTASFVLRPDTEEKHFRFAHTSLQEFFLAAYLVRALKEKKAERWGMPRVSRETFDFVGQMMVLEGMGAGGLDGLLGGGVDGNVATTRDSAGLAARATVQAFEYWVRAVEKGYPVPNPGHVNLAGANLEAWKIRDLSLRGADLRGVQLNGARVERVDLSGADLTGVEAREAVLVDVRAENVTGDGGDLGWPKWRGGSISGSVGLTRLGKEITRWSLAGSGEAIAVVGHSSTVGACAVSGDGRRAVSGSDDNTLRVWDLESGQCLRVLQGHESLVMACAVSGDGRRGVSGSADRTLRVWDLESGQCLQVLEGHEGSVKACAVSGDGRRLVSGATDNTLRVWDLESGRCLRVLQGHQNYVSACALSGDGRRVVSGSNDNTLRVWDLESGHCLRVLEGHKNTVTACAVSGDGKRVVSGSWDKTLRVWDLESGHCLRVLQGHEDPVMTCTVSGDGRRAVSGSWDKTLRVWDLDSGQCLRVLRGHENFVMACAVSGDGRRAVSGSGDNKLRVWDMESGQCLRVLEGHENFVMACAVSGDGRRAVSGSGDNRLRVWDMESGQCLRVLEGHENSVKACAVSGDGRWAVSASEDNTLRVWDLESGQCLRVLQGHQNSVRACAVSGDGRRAVSGSEDNTLRVWDLESGQCLRVLQGHQNSVRACAVSGDGRRAVSGSEDNTLRVWDLESGQCLRVLQGHQNSVRACAVSGDGRRAVSGSEDNTLRVWDLESGQCVRVRQGHVTACAVSGDGRRVVSGSDDNTLRVWDLESGQCLRVLQGHQDSVLACAVSGDGRRVVSGADALRVWDAESGDCLWTGYHFPEGNAASIGGNRFLWASSEAWRWLGWRVMEEGRTRLLPCEAFGPVPGLES